MNSIKKEKAGFFQWFLVIVIPLLFASMLVMIILSAAGVNIMKNTKEFANQLPLVSSFVTTDMEREEMEQSEQQEKLHAQLTDKDREIEQLTADVQDKESTIEELTNRVTELTNELTNQSESRQDREEIIQEISSSFKNMEPEAAAPIITSLDNNLAIVILQTISSQERGQILSQMEPNEAAELTNNLLEE